MTAQFRFDPEDHAYYLGDEKLPSTTGILQAVGIYKPSGFADEYDMWVGSASHRAIELYCKGTLDENNLDKQLRPRLDAYRKFERATGFKPYKEWIERPSYSELWRYGFTPDLVGEFPNGDCGVVDAKSGSVDPATAIQTASYAHGLTDYFEGEKTFRRFGLKVDKEGRPGLVEFTDHKDFAVWMNALSIYNWIRNNRKTK
jgi:hypothetical protein